MTDKYDVELWNAEGTKGDSRIVNATGLDKVVRDFKTFNTYSSISIIKKKMGKRRKGRKTVLGTPPTDLNERKYHEDGKGMNLRMPSELEALFFEITTNDNAYTPEKMQRVCDWCLKNIKSGLDAHNVIGCDVFEMPGCCPRSPEEIFNESFTGDPVTVGSAECDSCFIQLGQDVKEIVCNLVSSNLDKMERK